MGHLSDLESFHQTSDLCSFAESLVRFAASEALSHLRSSSLAIQPQLPVWIRWVDGEPKIVAGGVAMAAFNTELRHRARHDGATGKRHTCHGLRTTLPDWRGRGG